ncbi:hypothetical protein RQP53_03460 [Paucibacter sp. APW11]|uniref:CRISPR-associated protein Cas2 n=1 Tax=Roseateles aquae TaxID=3077235 RepID=A0ABU3P6Z3_9BURK|nr:hypothetical protein [Paucibacter sp. APW11]MDT8998330.1 hypothetical protein [Paucibacter sp. APW11]
MNNLFISYDLHAPGRSYDRVIETIKKLGNWAAVNQSMWYVRSRYNSESAVAALRQAGDSNDSFCVIDATNNNAHWYNIDQKVAEQIQMNWRAN